VAVDPHIPAAATVPVALNPAGVGVWRFGEVAWNPDVTGAVPAVIAGLPNPAGVRRNGDNLNRPRWRGPNPYNNLCAGRGGRQGDAEGCNQERLLDLHGSFSFEEDASYSYLKRLLAEKVVAKRRS